MPRGFREEERARIREQLLQAGRAQLERYGLRRTSVEELAAAAGISKGAFYRFFPSKEDLVFEVLEGAEAAFRAEVFGREPPPGPPRAALAALLRHAIMAWKRAPLLRALSLDEYQALVLRMDPDRARAHREEDARAVAAFATRWREAGILGAGDPLMLTELMRAVFFISLHETAFDADIYPLLIEQITDMIAARYAAEETP